MKKIFIIFFLFVIVLNASISAETWSNDLGRMDFNYANARCRSLGMRLPTIGELKAAYESGLTRSSGIYWSSTPYNAERCCYVLNVVTGGLNFVESPNNLFYVLCLR